MSRDLGQPEFKPLIAIVRRVDRAMQADMLLTGHARGHTEVKAAHNAVFATLHPGGTRAVDMAARNGISRQSMGEIVRDMESLGLLETVTDPEDRRAKLVRYTDAGRAVARDGYRHIHELEDWLSEQVGPEEFATMRHALTRVYELLEDRHGRT